MYEVHVPFDMFISLLGIQGEHFTAEPSSRETATLAEEDC